MKLLNNTRLGFTLVELIIVVAILAILSVAVFAALDPAKKTKQARDAARKSTLVQIAGGISNFYTIKNFYVSALTDLVPDELTVVPTGPKGSNIIYKALNDLGGLCATADENCKKAVLYDVYELPKNPCASGQAYWAWTSGSGRLGKVCSMSTPSPDDLPLDDL